MLSALLYMYNFINIFPCDQRVTTNIVVTLVITNTKCFLCFRIVEPHEVPDLESAQQFIFDFFKDHKEHELVFKKLAFLMPLKQ